MSNNKCINNSIISNYLFDSYIEYYDSIPVSNLLHFKDGIYRTIFENEQPGIFEYMIKKIPLAQENLIHIFKTYFVGESYSKEFINILIKYYPELQKKFLTIEYFVICIKNKKLNFFKELVKFRLEHGVNTLVNYEILHTFDKNMTDQNKIKQILDINVFYWMISESLIILNDKIKETIIYDYLTYKGSDKENFTKILNNINFDEEQLKNLLTKTLNNRYYKCTYGCNILIKLIEFYKIDLIYYLFDIISPSTLIDKNKTREIIICTIESGDYKLFKFIVKQILLLGYEFFENSFHNKLDTIVNNYKFRDNEKIIYEILKLGIQAPKGTKFYELYKNIKIK